MTNFTRYPPILWRELRSALAALRHVPSEDFTELLSRYRATQRKYFAEHGISGTYSPSSVPAPAPVPLELHDSIRRLDEAFQKIHHYNRGGAADYLADGVMRAANRAIAKRSRGLEERCEQEQIIFDALMRARYSDSDNKKAIKLRLMSNLGITQYQISKVIRNYGLARKKKT